MNKYIHNIDNTYWRVRLLIDGERLTKCFNFNKHKSKDNALKKAKTWRDKMLRTYGLTDTVHQKRRSNYYGKYRGNHCIGISLSTSNWGG